MFLLYQPFDVFVNSNTLLETSLVVQEQLACENSRLTSGDFQISQAKEQSTHTKLKYAQNMQFAFIFETVSTRLGANHLPDKVWEEKFIFLSLAIHQASKRGGKLSTSIHRH